MPPDALTVLLASNHAEEVMQITKSLRSFYPGCRIEAVYTLEEILEWANKQDWHMVLLDETLLPDVSDAVRRLRTRVTRSAVIMIGERQETSRALEAMRQGADYYLFKNTPTFLIELPLIAREVLEKRDVRARLELAHARFGRLIDTLSDVVYELDREGRFVYVSPQVRGLLHYDPQELIGQHYSVVVAEGQEAARWRFNERRSDARAGRGSRIRARDKQRAQASVEIEVTARSLYDPHGRFIGTIGVMRPARSGQEAAPLSRLSDLTVPLSDILATTQHLLERIESTARPAPPPPSPPADQGTVEKAEAGMAVPPEPALKPPAEREERRRAARLDTHLEVQLAVNGQTWEGTAATISMAGVYITVLGHPPVRPGQRARLSLTSEVGILEIDAQITEIRARATPEGAKELSPSTGLVIRFLSLTDVETKIIHSLLEGLRTRSIVVTLRLLIVPDNLPRKIEERPPESQNQREQPSRPSADRRLAVRIHVSLPVLIGPAGARPSTDGTIMNISSGGACIELASEVERPEGRVTLGFEAAMPPGRGAAPERSDSEMLAEVVWTKMTERAARLEPADRGQAQVLHVGLRFIHDLAARSRIESLISRFLESLTRPPEFPADRLIVSELVSCRTEQDRQIALYHDHIDPLPSDCPLVIVSPGYGETKTDYVLLSYYFACNGFHVLRYDHTNHIGESDGGMVSTTMGGMASDLQSVVTFARQSWPASSLTVVAADLSARTALKAVRALPHVKLLVLLGPVLDLRYALQAIHREDVVAAAFEGKKQGVTNIFGFNIDADVWLRDAIRHGYTDLASTLRDVEALRMPVVVVSSHQDTTINPEHVRAVRDAFHDYLLEWKVEAESLKQVCERPEQAARVFRGIVARCRAWFYPLAGHEVIDPPAEEARGQAQLERERLRLHHQMTKTNHVNFWRDYLDRSHYLINFSDYWHLLDHIYRLLGPLERDARLLDAGCGNGNFGTFLLISRSLRGEAQPDRSRIHYVGVDLVPSGLDQARQNFLRVAAELRGKFADAVRPQSVMTAELLCADLDIGVPLHDNTFDRVVCNLVIGYLHDPLFTLRELLRVLVPGGKLVITNFKPEADLSQIYRNFLALPRTQTEVERAKQILEASGNLTQRAREGGVRFFDRQELAILLMSCGAVQPRIYSAFANQAYIAIAEKPA